MVNRTPVSTPRNIWFDAKKVDSEDLNVESNYNLQVSSSLISNHIGSGVLPEVLTEKVLYSTPDLDGYVDGYFDEFTTYTILDGVSLSPSAQPSDTTYGNQLEVELSGSKVAGKRSVKVCIIGLDFNSNLQYDTFYFFKNEKQYTSKHYVRILSILFNDLSGDSNKSLNLGGKVIIKEAPQFRMSRDAIMVSQDLEPNLFFKNFFTADGSTLDYFLTNALPDYDIDGLNITTSYKQIRTIAKNDVTTRIAQKFKATTNNIQKITLLLAAVGDNFPTNPSDFVWNGDLVVSIYALQSNVPCPSDFVPNLAIDYEPTNTPLAELSINYNSLLDSGYQLSDNPQPIDFVFSNTQVSRGTLVPGNYYIVTIKRSGLADYGTIRIPTANDRVDDSRLTIYNGSTWTDITTEDLWFQIWTDAAKVSSGMAYENGKGITLVKNKIDEYGENSDYSLDKLSFYGNNLYTGVLQSITEESNLVQDEKTGNLINSNQEFVPSVNLYTQSQLDNLSYSDLLKLGNISDKNVKSIELTNTLFSAYLRMFGVYENNIFIKIIDDPTDPRYDLSVNELVYKFASGAFNGAKFIPDVSDTSNYFRVSDVNLLTMKYGDVNGDGIVDEEDLLLASEFVDYDINSSPLLSKYPSFVNPFKTESSVTFDVVDNVPVIFASGSDGVITPDPLDPTLSLFTSLSIDFTTIPNLDLKYIQIATASNPENIGTYKVFGLIDLNNISIKKVLYTEETILKLYRADVTGNLNISSADLNLIENYVYKVSPFPDTAPPGNKIGTSFNVLKITLEKYLDRLDDYSPILNRSTVLHTLPNLFNDVTAYQGHNFLATPVQFQVERKLVWNDYNILVNPSVREVPCIFTDQSADAKESCSIEGVVKEEYPNPSDFNPGKNDLFIPNSLLIDYGGEIKRPDGNFYKVDFEIANVVLEIPAIDFTEEKCINLFSDFIANYSGTGFTRLGLEAMRFADCSFVGLDALSKNQVRISVSTQSFSPDLDGIDDLDGYTGNIVDNKIGVYVDYSTGLLYLNFSNLYKDPIKKTLSTKLQIQVMLKKAGFNNKNLFIDSDKVKNILGL